MTERRNQYGQPTGPELADWTPRARPTRDPLSGHWCRLGAIDAKRDAAELYEAYAQAPDGRDWTYMSAEPFANEAQYWRRSCTRPSARSSPAYSSIMACCARARATR